MLISGIGNFTFGLEMAMNYTSLVLDFVFCVL